MIVPKKHKLDSLRIIALFVLLFGIVYFYINLFCPFILPFFLKLGVIDRPINILILGTDITYNLETHTSTTEKGRSDAIILLHFDPIKSKLNLVSIPRDSYVEIPGYGYSKINASFVFGGVNLTKQTIENLIGIHIDKFLAVNIKGTIKLVDILGGVWIDVEKNLYYVDRAGNLYINLKAGYQKLSGKDAEGYIRFRHDAMGDLTRIERQQKFLKALSSRLLNPLSIMKAPFIVEIIMNNIRTDLSLEEFILLANTIRTIPSKNIGTTTLKGDSTNNEAGSVIILDPKELKNTIKNNF